MRYIIHVPNEETSRQVQDILFAAGKGWDGGANKTHEFSSFPFLYVSTEYPRLSCGCSFEIAVNNLDDHEPLDASSVLLIFRPLQPEKMVTISGKEWSESTIAAALKRYVNE